MFGVGGFTGGKANGPVYEVEVNEGSMNVGRLEKVANDRAANGYRMAHIIEQQRNTVVVWERISLTQG